jgi:hypothetical protein
MCVTGVPGNKYRPTSEFAEILITPRSLSVISIIGSELLDIHLLNEISKEKYQLSLIMTSVTGVLEIHLLLCKLYAYSL